MVEYLSTGILAFKPQTTHWFGQPSSLLNWDATNPNVDSKKVKKLEPFLTMCLTGPVPYQRAMHQLLNHSQCWYDFEIFCGVINDPVPSTASNFMAFNAIFGEVVITEKNASWIIQLHQRYCKPVMSGGSSGEHKSMTIIYHLTWASPTFVRGRAPKLRKKIALRRGTKQFKIGRTSPSREYFSLVSNIL